MIKLLNLDRQHAAIKPELDEAINAVIAQSEFIGGMRNNPFVHKFEQEFADYVGVKHCIGVGSGTDAISVVMRAAKEIKMLEFPIVSIPANTAYPVAEALLNTPFTSVKFVDCDPVTYTVIPERVTMYCRATIICHQYGHPCDMNSDNGVVFWTKEVDDVFLIEDCSHAHGAKYKGQNVGTFGDAAIFSFNPTKILGAMGDAGCIVTDDDDLADMCRRLSDHGRREKYTHDYIGWNSRMDGIQAAVLSVKLKHLDEWVERRRKIACHYLCTLADSAVVLPLGPSANAKWELGHFDNGDEHITRWASLSEEIVHSYHQFVIRVENRDVIRKRLLKKGIQTNIHYSLSLPEQPALQYLGVNPDDFIATQLSHEILSLPINESMTDEEVEIVCKALKEVLDD